MIMLAFVMKPAMKAVMKAVMKATVKARVNTMRKTSLTSNTAQCCHTFTPLLPAPILLEHAVGPYRQ